MLLNDEQYVIKWLSQYGALPKTQVLRLLRDKSPDTAEKTPAEAARRRRWYIHPSQCPDNGAHPSASKAPQRTRQTTAFRRPLCKSHRRAHKAQGGSKQPPQRPAPFPEKTAGFETVLSSGPNAFSCPRMTRVSLVHRQTPQTPIKITDAAAAVICKTLDSASVIPVHLSACSSRLGSVFSPDDRLRPGSRAAAER